MKDKDKIINLYAEERILFKEREVLNMAIADIREDMKSLVSQYYWGSEYKLHELESMLGIPVNQMHLYCKSRTFEVKCIICGKSMSYKAKSIAERDSTYIGNATCSNKCRTIALEA